MPDEPALVETIHTAAGAKKNCRENDPPSSAPSPSASRSVSASSVVSFGSPIFCERRSGTRHANLARPARGASSHVECRGSYPDDAHGSVHRDFDAKLATLVGCHSVTVSVIGRTDSAASKPSTVLCHHHGTVHGRARVSQVG